MPIFHVSQHWWSSKHVNYISDEDISATAAIAESKIDLANPQHTHAAGAVTQPDQHAAQSHTGGAVNAHQVTQPGAHSDHSILPPYFTVYVWKRTA